MSIKNKIAVLIDGDNAESETVEQILNEAGRFGRVTVKRIYGDWTENRMKRWKEQLNHFAIRPMQKFSYTTGKNSTDTALIIDAMDLVHTKQVDGFCIVSSDSDYTGLAHRIREEGLFVMGIGRAHTPEAFVKACETFTFLEILSPPEVKEIEEPVKPPLKEKKTAELAPRKPKHKVPGKTGKIDLNLIGSLRKSGVSSLKQKDIDNAFNMVVDINTGMAYLSQFAEALRKMDPTFDYRNFGFGSFKDFCESLKPSYVIVLKEDGVTVSLKKNK